MGIDRRSRRLAVALVASIAVTSCARVPASLAPSGPDTPGAGTILPTSLTSAAPSLAASASPPPGLTWVVRPIPEFTTYGGADLAGSSDGAVRYTHAVVSNLEEAWPGFNDASVYVRTADDGETWGQRLLLGGIDPAIAAADDRVYIAIEAYACRSGIGVLVNDRHGADGSWAVTHCLTTNRELNSEWAPTVAANGAYVYVASVDSRTGRLNAWVSADRGSSWTQTVLGDARPDDDLCCVGPVSVATAGTEVAVMWSDRGSLLARVSEDAGSTWGDATELGSQDNVVGGGAAGRLAFAGRHSDRSPWIRAWIPPDGWRAVTLPTDETLGAPDHAAVAFGLDGAGATTYLACWIDHEAGGMTVSTASARDLRWSVPAPAPGCAEALATEDGEVLQVVEGDDEQDYAYALGVAR